MTVDELETRPKRRRAETVERLLDAALETFAEIGFAAATVEDICRRGGFTRGAFYSSFRTKDELFAALFSRETGRNRAIIEEQLAGIESEADPVAAGIERCLNTLRADRTWVLVHAEYVLHAARHPEAAALLREHTAAQHVQLSALIDEVAGRVGLRLAVSAGELAHMVLALHDGVVLRQAGLTEPTLPESAGFSRATDIERAGLLLLLRAAVLPAPTD